jgi:hypothetical protein
MALVKQFSIFLENSPGRLANLVDALAQNGIRILALGIAEAGNYGIVRMIVDNDDKALEAMHKANMAVNQTEVIIIDLFNLGDAVRILSQQGTNIDYAYTMDRGRAVIKVNEPGEALKSLSANNLKVYSKGQTSIS